MQIIIYTNKGDSMAMPIMGQLKSLLSSKKINAQVRVIDDPAQLKMNGIDQTPAVVLDGLPICMGYVPSRTELDRSLDRYLAAKEKTGEQG